MKCITIAAAAVILMLARPSEASAQAFYDCQMRWTRADNMWGSYDSAQKNLGEETLRLSDQKRTQTFITDWKHEKQRNDGRTFYGSHARSIGNSGTGWARITLKNQFGTEDVVLPPTSGIRVNGDILLMECFGQRP